MGFETISLILLIFTLLFTSFAILWIGKFRDTSIAAVWAFVLSLAAWMRIILEFFPASAGLFGRILLISTFAIAIVLLWKQRKQLVSLKKNNYSHLPYQLAFIFLMLRNFFPAFDVDSLTYHLSALEWMAAKESLPPFQQKLQNISIWFSWISVEESLSIPGLGMNLPFYAGLTSGAMKLLAVSTVTLLVPKHWPLLRTLVVFFFLMDDHFLFSAQSRFVYINPLLIGLAPLSVWLTWRGARGSIKHTLLAFASLFGLASIKYHGIYFCIPLFIILFLSTLFLLYSKKIQYRKNFTSIYFIGFGFFCSSIPVFFFHWYFRGSPVFPFPIGPFQPELGNRGIELLMDNFNNKKNFQNILDFFRFMIYPQNLAIKITTFLWVPTLFLPFIKIRSMDRRSLWLALLCLSITAMWCWKSYTIAYIDSRYPRYIFGVAILGLVYLLIGLRKNILLQKIPLFFIIFVSSTYVLSFLENKFIRYPLGILICTFFLYGMYRTPRKFSPIAVSIFLIAIIFISVDLRQYNVVRSQHPKWKNIWYYLTESRSHPLDVKSKSMQGLLRPLADDIFIMRKCMQEYDKIHKTRLVLGESLLIFGPDSVWPSLLLGPAAIQGAAFEGGGFIHLNKASDLIDHKIFYALAPKDNNIPYSAEGPTIKIPSGEKEKISLSQDPICESPLLALYKIAEK